MEEDDNNKITCPKCGAEIPYFITTKQSRFAKCPVCGSQFNRKELEEKYGKHRVVLVSKEIYKKAGKVPLDKLMSMIRGSSDEESEDIDDNLEDIKASIDRELKKKTEDYTHIKASEVFQRPRDPCDVLKEVLDMYDFLKEDFKKMMVRRCELMNQLHPLELYHFLKTMRSGVKTEMEAAFIAEDYAMALKAEEEKARSLGYNYILPNINTMPPVKSSETPIIQRIMEIMKSTNSIPSTRPINLPTSTGNTVNSNVNITNPSSTNSPVSNIRSKSDIIDRIRDRIIYDRPRDTSNPNVLIDVGNIVRAVVESNKPIQELMVNLIDKIGEKKDDTKDILLATLLKMINDLQNKMSETQAQIISNSISEAVKMVAEQISKQQEQINQILNVILASLNKKESIPPEVAQTIAEAKAKSEFMEKLLELQDKQYKQMMSIILSESKKREAELKSVLQAWQKEREELIKRLSVMQSASGEFKSDEAKLLAQALNNLSLAARDTFRPLVENLAKREPVKLIMDNLPKVIMLSSSSMPEEIYKVSEEKPKKTKTSKEIIEELEKEGLVEE